MLWLRASPDTPRCALCESRSLTLSWCERDGTPSRKVPWYDLVTTCNNYRKARCVLGGCIAFWALSQLSWITKRHEMHHRRADSESVVFVPMISKFPEVETTLHFAHKDSISYHKEPTFWQVSTLNSWLQYGSNANITNTIWRLLSHGQLKKLQCGHHKEGSWCWDRTTSCSFYTHFWWFQIPSQSQGT